MRSKRAYTLVELLVTVSILATLAVVAVPRLQFGAVYRTQAQQVARMLMGDLRLTRMQALNAGADSEQGFSLVLTSPPSPLGYCIRNQQSGAIVQQRLFPDGIRVQGSNGHIFSFGPLGNLLDGSGTVLHISTNQETYRIQIIPATGAVQWQEGN